MSLEVSETVIVVGLIVAAAGLWASMPRFSVWLRSVAAFLAAVGLLAAVSATGDAGGEFTEKVLFWIFATAAVGCAALMIGSRNPVHGALWFAVATLGVCGLFLQLSAPFLAAATVIVYAGAIIVTFMFVIMLAQQEGITSYDQTPRLPIPAIGISFFVLGSLMVKLLRWNEENPLAAAARQGAESTSRLATLGRALFGEYLFAVELAGTLLLIATVGAICLAPRRSRGNL